jgi:hypothetical protein
VRPIEGCPQVHSYIAGDEDGDPPAHSFPVPLVFVARRTSGDALRDRLADMLFTMVTDMPGSMPRVPPTRHWPDRVYPNRGGLDLPILIEFASDRVRNLVSQLCGPDSVGVHIPPRYDLR